MTSPDAHGDLYVHTAGPDDAPVLLLLHGSAASSRSWDAMVPLLTAHHVIRFDLPGHGRSAAPADHDYTLPRQAGRFGDALDRLGVRRAVVVGHSSGGYAATALAEQRPDLVAALALINTGPSMAAFIAPPDQAALDPDRWPPADDQLRRMASTGFRPGYEVPRDLIDELRGMSLQAVAAAMRASTGYLNERALPDRLAAVGKPLLVIFGDQDRRWRPSSAADYRAVPGAEIAMLPGAGHTPILEEPSRTAALLLAFAERLARDDRHPLTRGGGPTMRA
ncbi:alpha/beta fold hydrolase [Streptomyces flavofungini]|uniref:alpha/beta fold hydrolase n=1 Tax=Streptomyces flavofungini TaxID=68200 RepID=UPI0034DFE30E